MEVYIRIEIEDNLEIKESKAEKVCRLSSGAAFKGLAYRKYRFSNKKEVKAPAILSTGDMLYQFEES